MAVFIANNGLISRDSSIITGSLNVTGGITASFFGTASYVVTSSYSLSSATASYTVATSIDSSSYALTTVSASVALTASTVNGLFFGPTQGIGVLSPNMYLGAPNTIQIVATSSYNGTLYTPIIINKPCTLVTMSIVGGTSLNTTCSFGLYTNSTSSNLPQFLLAEGVLLRNVTVTTPTVFNVSNFTPVKLQANTVYWLAFLNNGNASGQSTFRYLYHGTTGFLSYNTLLGNMMSVTASNIAAPHWCIRSGSSPRVGAVTALATTASQDTGSYGFVAAGFINTPVILPVLRVTYP